jgi:tetratricopeptide (TPR) repeat protein
MKKLDWPDNHHLEAATGWLELENWAEANKELDRIAPRNRFHPDVLQVRCKIYAAAEKWQMMVEVAGALCRLMPDSSFGPLHLSYALRKLDRTREALDVLLPLSREFGSEWRIPFQLACCACLLGMKQQALLWLEQAIDAAGQIDIRMKALDESDLETLWLDIAEI